MSSDTRKEPATSRSRGNEFGNGYEEEVDLRLFLALLKRDWKLLAIVTLVVVGMGGVYGVVHPGIYRSEVLVVPVDKSDSGLSALANQVGGIASLPGLGLAGARSLDNATLALEILESRAFLSDFIARREILVPLLAHDGWDTESQMLRIDNSIYAGAERGWLSGPLDPDTGVPRTSAAVGVFRKLLDVETDSGTGLSTIAVEFESPRHAQRWAGWLIEDLNERMREMDAVRARANVEYLTEKAQSTTLVEVRRIFFQLIEEQTKTLMLAEAGPDYVFRIIDPPVVPHAPVWPKTRLILVACMLVGLMLAVFVILFRRAWTSIPNIETA